MAPRTILYTGKGGVGKTSVAAATARAIARKGARTVVLSTDPAHSLSDSLEAELGSTPTPAGSNLWGQEVQAQEEMERHWDSVQDWLGSLLEERGVDRIAAEELTVPPGGDELFSLLRLKRHVGAPDRSVERTVEPLPRLLVVAAGRQADDERAEQGDARDEQRVATVAGLRDRRGHRG